jgi:hypothetical protein
MTKKKISLPLKFAIAILWDIADFTIFRIPVIGTVTDLISIPLALYLWGPIGIVSSWELADLTDQIDAEIPTLTLIGIILIIKS